MMNHETKTLLEESKSKPRKRIKPVDLSNCEAIFSNSDSRKQFVVHTAKGVLRHHKKAMELLADK